MNQSKKAIIENLLIDVNSIKMDIQGANGNPAIAKANQLASIIQGISKHQNLFPTDVQIQINAFVRSYRATQKGDEIYSQAIFKLIDPTRKSIIQFLEKRLIELD